MKKEEFPTKIPISKFSSLLKGKGVIEVVSSCPHFPFIRDVLTIYRCDNRGLKCNAMSFKVPSCEWQNKFTENLKIPNKTLHLILNNMN